MSHHRITRRSALVASAGLLMAAKPATETWARRPDPATPPWSEAEIAALRDVLTEAPRHGLNAGPFLAQLDRASGEDLTRLAQTYARALARGLVDPRDLHSVCTLAPPELDVVSGVAIARASGRLAPWLRSLPPTDAAYRALSEAGLRQILKAADTTSPDIPAGPPIRAGAADPRLAAIAERLVERGLAQDLPSSSSQYGPDLEAGVRRLQRDAGLRLDGIVGPETLAELNQGPQDRARQLALNLERRRWLARRTAATRIDVNIARGSLTYYRDGEPVRRARVVVGAVGHETPLLAESFQRLVVNPPWRVPRSIAAAEILPRGAGYLRSRNMYVADGRVIQRPGPGAALGLVKFDMQNPYAIYLHDTPAKALFAASDRRRSHGCVRVEDAVDFARQLARERGRLEAFDAALASGETRSIDLGAPIPVRLLYLTASLGAGGSVRYTQDGYGWDAVLGERMGLGPARLRAQLPLPADLLGP